ncbi:hypothetical protein CRG98_018410 [Punica granatum]|uniref:Retrotransposon gag domain-containing protein n=1 Tax=Punica granatum TaxID=22663 RepID=A0A2I0JXX5_PUNGR|nr:hypothetical protein CRG98_018410 [Punica granatum]
MISWLIRVNHVLLLLIFRAKDRGTNNTPNLRHRPALVEIGRFSGTNPEAWTFQVEHYFEFYKINPDHQLDLASFYLEGAALEWYWWMFRNKQQVDWPHLAKALVTRFRKKDFEAPEGRLAKLRQHTTVTEYQASFEAISNETMALPGRSPPLLPTPSTPTSSVGSPITPPTTLPGKQPVKRLSYVEAQQRREKDLCFYCDEKYTFNHKCASQPKLFLCEDEGGQHSEPVLETSSDTALAEELQVQEELFEVFPCQFKAVNFHLIFLSFNYMGLIWFWAFLGWSPWVRFSQIMQIIALNSIFKGSGFVGKETLPLRFNLSSYSV